MKDKPYRAGWDGHHASDSRLREPQFESLLGVGYLEKV